MYNCRIAYFHESHYNFFLITSNAKVAFLLKLYLKKIFITKILIDQFYSVADRHERSHKLEKDL